MGTPITLFKDASGDLWYKHFRIDKIDFDEYRDNLGGLTLSADDTDSPNDGCWRLRNITTSIPSMNWTSGSGNSIFLPLRSLPSSSITREDDTSSKGSGALYPLALRRWKKSGSYQRQVRGAGGEAAFQDPIPKEALYGACRGFL